MLSLVFNKKRQDTILTSLWKKLKKLYNVDSIDESKKQYLIDQIEKYGYLPYSHIKALTELSDAEVIFALEQKFLKSNVFIDSKFKFENDQISPVKRAGYKNSDWIKKEQHNIKLINLAGLGNGNISHQPAKFIDWLRQLLILPSGNKSKNILSTTMYLIPFHPREFGCAYLPTSSEVSANLEDKFIKDNLNLDAKAQVQLFIKLSQLADHPVIFDILPQTGRFSKIVLSNPKVVRWYDINELISKIENEVDIVSKNLESEFDKDDIETTVKIYKKILKGGSSDISDFYKNIYNKLNSLLLEKKKQFSDDMLKKESQIKLAKKATNIIAETNNAKLGKIKAEKDIKNQGKTIEALIKEGLWPAPGGAWCSCGVPIFDKMSECGSFPMFKHFDIECNDVTNYANLDCQSPYYFVYLENGEYNNKVIDYFIDLMQDLQKDYNFDGFRVDHIDHIVDKVSEKNGKPISYRAPQKVLEKLNTTMKSKIPYFASLAEYMLWDDYLSEYNQNMNFDILWGNDIISQYNKTPQVIIQDNNKLEQYNKTSHTHNSLSILKTYNNQDGEFNVINQYPGQLGEKGALFKWFKYKFLPGGKNAQRPVMFIDGDESFTKTGIESVIGSEISMMRNNNDNFFYKFDAILRFALNNEFTNSGEAQLITQTDDGFAAWVINKDPLKEALLIVCNYLYESEVYQDENGNFNTKYGHNVYNHPVDLPCDFKIIAQYEYDEHLKDFKEIIFDNPLAQITFYDLAPSDFKIYKMVK